MFAQPYDPPAAIGGEMDTHEHYISEVFVNFKGVMNRLEKQLDCLMSETSKVPTHLLVRGVSGVSVGPALAAKLGLGLCVSRKQDGTHSRFNCECSYLLPVMVVVFVDDFVSSGSTMSRAFETLVHEIHKNNRNRHNPKVRKLYHLGNILYALGNCCHPVDEEILL